MNRLNSALFKGICLAFSVAALVLTLLGSVKLAELSTETAELEDKLWAAEEEKRLLSIKAENSVSLEELEQYATQKLGMQPPSAGQIIYIDLDLEG